VSGVKLFSLEQQIKCVWISFSMTPRAVIEKTNPWNRVLLENLRVAQLLRNVLRFMVPEGA
jgi:hypothetical protein